MVVERVLHHFVENGANKHINIVVNYIILREKFNVFNSKDESENKVTG